MFSKILIANRGEVAIRIIRACKEMGILTVAVFSEADREALHASLADECYCIGPPKAADSYLNMDAILTIAKASGAEAIHPGYGFLSENAEFARECERRGIAFIGPSPDVIEKMGDKDAARMTMRKANVPVITGSRILKDALDAKNLAEVTGYPVLLKARSGGGGRGIRLVENSEELESIYQSASLEAESAFKDGALYLEKFLFPVKHIEVQLLCDDFGHVVILGDRDCSVQRKNQKFIEEAPAPLLPDKVRSELYAAARRAAKIVRYNSVGTVEFLLDKDNHFYFMEMNTRLQVEHSVTEMVCGVDIVKWQIRVAAGMKIPFSDHDISHEGHAIECRICAEHPFKFLPASGEIQMLHIPGGMNVRFDSAIYQGYIVPPYYDSLLGKLIVFSRTREEALRKMKSALSELVIDGIFNNAELYLELLNEPQFMDGSYTTDFLKKIGYA